MCETDYREGGLFAYVWDRLYGGWPICLIVDAKFGEDLKVTSTETPVSSPQNAGKIFSLSTGL